MTAAGATVGKSMLFDLDQPACYAGYLVRFRPASDVDPGFVSYWTESKPYWQQVSSGKVVSTIDNFSAGKYQNLWIDIPSLLEQRAISDYLDAETARIDAIVENRRKQVRLLDLRRSGVVVRSATGGALRDAEGHLSFPNEWARTRLRFLVEPPQAGDWGDDPTGVDDTFVVRAADFDRKHWKVDPARLPPRAIEKSSLLQRRLRAGDLVLEKSGGGPDQPVGATVSFDLDIQALPSNFAARVRPTNGIDGRFLCYALAATYEIGLTQRSIKQTTGIQNLDVGAYLSEDWAVPSHAEQVRIGAEIDGQLSAIDALQAASERQIDLLLERRQALISAAVTGELQIDGVVA